MTIDTKAETFAAKAYETCVPTLEHMLTRGIAIKRSDIETLVRREVFRTDYAMDDKMVEYVTDSLAGSYIG